jgi:hypothetical protein
MFFSGDAEKLITLKAYADNIRGPEIHLLQPAATAPK